MFDFRCSNLWMTAGFEKLMPEKRPFPSKLFPRRGVPLSITFGEPIPDADIKAALGAHLAAEKYEDPLRMTEKRTVDELESRTRTLSGWLGESAVQETAAGNRYQEAHEVARVRSAVTAVLQREVEALGRRVCGEVDRP